MEILSVNLIQKTIPLRRFFKVQHVTLTWYHLNKSNIL